MAPRAALPRPLLQALLLLGAFAGLAESHTYVIASFPQMRAVNYLRLPDPVWRPLIVNPGLTAPQSICVDYRNNRLYVADPASLTVYWFQLITTADGSLISDGRDHKAVVGFTAKGLVLSSTGTLYLSGILAANAALGEPAKEGIFKQDVIALATAETGTAPLPPVPIWTRANSGHDGSPERLWTPSAIAVNPFHVFWGNSEDGRNRGAVVRGRLNAGLPGQTLRAMSDNVDGVTAIVLTPVAVFYAAEGGVYGVPLDKASDGCGSDGKVCPKVVELEKPSAMIWDGDGTVYVADAAAGAIYSFASGSLSPHIKKHVNDAAGINGLAVFSNAEDSSGCGGRRPGLPAILLALGAALMLAQ